MVLAQKMYRLIVPSRYKFAHNTFFWKVPFYKKDISSESSELIENAFFKFQSTFTYSCIQVTPTDYMYSHKPFILSSHLDGVF